MSAPDPQSQARGAVGPVLLIALLLAALPLFWFGLQSLGRAWVTPEYSYGPLIPLISTYLFLREMRAEPWPLPPARDGWPGLGVLGLALAVGWLGNLMKIPDIVAYALILWIGGVVLVWLGWRCGRRHMLPVLHLIFMLPLPQIFYWKLSVFLQGLSSQLGVALIGAAGVTVRLDGNVIDLGIYQLLVAEACSGLRYLFPVLSFSYLFAILYRGPIWHKATLLLAAAPLTVAMNSVRIALIGILVDRYGIAQAEGFLHFFEGWVIFMICVALLFLMAVTLQRLRPAPLPLRDVLDLDTNRFAEVAGRIRSARMGWLRGAALGLTALASLLWLLLPTAPHLHPNRASLTQFPMTLGDWTGQTITLDPEVQRILAADDYVNAFYKAPGEKAEVSFFVAYYGKQTEGQGIHSPEVCLPTGGWEVSDLREVTLDMRDQGYGTFVANRAVIQQGLTQQLVYYWFEGRGQRFANDVRAKMQVLYDSLGKGRTDGALVRLVTQIAPGESSEDADARILRMMHQGLKPLPRFVPF